MKIQCDVCNKEAANFFCCADEAALCQDCDKGIHHANKLAGKHRRFSLYQPLPSKQTSLCDVCKGKRAFLFCQEDRAILCPDCDVSIHTANELTAKHNRFFLTGIRLVVIAPSATNPPGVKAPSRPVSAVGVVSPATSSPVAAVPDNCNEKVEVGSATSISDYLIHGIPGMHVEELLDNNGSGFTDSLGFSSLDNWFKTDDMLKYMEPRFGGDFGYVANPARPTMQVVCRVPNIPVPTQNSVGVGVHGSALNRKAANDQMMGEQHHPKAGLLYTGNGFTVPQMGPFPPKSGRWC